MCGTLAASVLQRSASMQVVFCSNRGEQGPLLLAPGVYGLSNGSFGSRWPKTELSKASLQVG